MGIGSTLKHMVRDERHSTGDTEDRPWGDDNTGRANPANGPHKLPPGTGPGTTGKPAPTDATGRATDERTTFESSGHAGVLESLHPQGHPQRSARESMPSGPAQEDTNQLNPVTHETIRHLETEEVQRVRDLERHIHHVQHHIQPIIASETLPERIRENVHPTTNIREVHANKREDSALFEGQVHQLHDTMTRGPTERTIVDKGTTVHEHVHHHVHHVIQPVIERETIERERIHTTIPIHQVTHEAPVVHQSERHAPVSIEHFVERGGKLTGAVSQDEIGSRVLRSGQCTRDVEGVAESVSKILNLPEDTGRVHDPAQTSSEERGGFTSAGGDRSSHRPQHDATTETPHTVTVA